MKQDIEGMSLFQQVLDETPKEVRQQVEWSYDIADKLDAKLHQLGVSQKEFARRGLCTPSAFPTKTLTKTKTELRDVYPPDGSFRFRYRHR